MMNSFKAAAIVAFASGALAALDKPVLQDDSNDLAVPLQQLTPEQPYTLTPYEEGMIPEDCAGIGSSEQTPLSPADFTNYYVKYDDCDDPWVFCVHKDGGSIDELATDFGKVPVGMRDFVKHIVGLPDGNGAFNSGGNIAFYGNFGAEFKGWLHESAHSLDGQGGFDNTIEGWYSDSQEWLDVYNADTNVPDTYAQTNQAENIAQVTVLGIFDKLAEGGIASVRSNWQGIENQLRKVQDKAGAKILPGGTCNRALQPSQPISNTGATSRIMARAPVGFSKKYSNLREARPYDSRVSK